MSNQGQKIGYVVSVSGARITGILAGPEDGAAHLQQSDIGHAAQIGTLVKIPMPKSEAFGMVSRLEVRDPSGPPNGKDCRVVEIDLFGESLANRAGGIAVPSSLR